MPKGKSKNPRELLFRWVVLNPRAIRNQEVLLHFGALPEDERYSLLGSAEPMELVADAYDTLVPWDYSAVLGLCRHPLRCSPAELWCATNSQQMCRLRYLMSIRDFKILWYRANTTEMFARHNARVREFIA